MARATWIRANTKRAWLALLIGVGLVGCDAQPVPQGSYFENNIQPILQMGCVQQTTGCHIERGAGTAAGATSICRATTR